MSTERPGAAGALQTVMQGSESKGKQRQLGSSDGEQEEMAQPSTVCEQRPNGKQDGRRRGGGAVRRAA